jgi:hypothetical protein
MRKSELLKAIQDEIQRHNLSTFWKDGVTQVGCSECRRVFGTVEQFKRHLAEEALPALLDRLSTEGKSTTEVPGTAS